MCLPNSPARAISPVLSRIVPFFSPLEKNKTPRFLPADEGSLFRCGLIPAGAISRSHENPCTSMVELPSPYQLKNRTFPYEYGSFAGLHLSCPLPTFRKLWMVPECQPALPALEPPSFSPKARFELTCHFPLHVLEGTATVSSPPMVPPPKIVQGTTFFFFWACHADRVFCALPPSPQAESSIVLFEVSSSLLGSSPTYPHTRLTSTTLSFEYPFSWAFLRH